LPPNSIDQQEAAELSTSFCHAAKDRSQGIKALYRRTGVRQKMVRNTELDFTDDNQVMFE